MDTTLKAITVFVLLSALVVFGRVAAIESVSAHTYESAEESVGSL